MEGYLLDTSALSPLVDETHPKHELAKNVITGLGGAPIYVSVIALAELMYGICLPEEAKNQKLSNAEEMLTEARRHPHIEVGHYTADEYAKLKSKVAVYHLPKGTKQFPKHKRVEEWVDQFTGDRLGIDDNDLWICAQARELNLTVIADDRMIRIRQADPLLKVLLLDP